MVDQSGDIGSRFSAYVEALVGVIGHKDRAGRCAIIARVC